MATTIELDDAVVPPRFTSNDVYTKDGSAVVVSLNDHPLFEFPVFTPTLTGPEITISKPNNPVVPFWLIWIGCVESPTAKKSVAIDYTKKAIQKINVI